MTIEYNAIDLFCGGGGLSLGLKKAGFKIVAGVETNTDAANTFELNFKDAKVFREDIRHLSSSELKAVIGSSGKLDLLAACPPCQSFSSLNSRYNESDSRNMLISEVLRLTTDLLPSVVMVENVPGITARGKAYLKNFVDGLVNLGYEVEYKIIQIADYGVPQLRKRFVLLAGLEQKISVPEPTHSKDGTNNTKPWETVGDALSGIGRSMTLEEAKEYGGPEYVNWHINRKLSDLNKKRIMSLNENASRFSIPDDIRPSCHKGKNKGFSNFYTRMSANRPSPTITGGCTTLSKGRFGHPTEHRAISIREAARLQSFPDDFRFTGKSIDSVCQIIGNAFPCRVSELLGYASISALQKKL